MRFNSLVLAVLASSGFYASALPVEPKRGKPRSKVGGQYVLLKRETDAAAVAKSEAAPGFKPVIVWEHTNSDDDDGMVYQWRRKE